MQQKVAEKDQAQFYTTLDQTKKRKNKKSPEYIEREQLYKNFRFQKDESQGKKSFRRKKKKQKFYMSTVEPNFFFGAKNLEPAPTQEYRYSTVIPTKSKKKAPNAAPPSLQIEENSTQGAEEVINKSQENNMGPGFNNNVIGTLIYNHYGPSSTQQSKKASSNKQPDNNEKKPRGVIQRFADEEFVATLRRLSNEASVTKPESKTLPEESPKFALQKHLDVNTYNLFRSKSKEGSPSGESCVIEQAEVKIQQQPEETQKSPKEPSITLKKMEKSSQSSSSQKIFSSRKSNSSQLSRVNKTKTMKTDGHTRSKRRKQKNLNDFVADMNSNQSSSQTTDRYPSGQKPKIKDVSELGALSNRTTSQPTKKSQRSPEKQQDEAIGNETSEIEELIFRVLEKVDSDTIALFQKNDKPSESRHSLLLDKKYDTEVSREDSKPVNKQQNQQNRMTIVKQLIRKATPDGFKAHKKLKNIPQHSTFNTDSVDNQRQNRHNPAIKPLESKYSIDLKSQKREPGIPRPNKHLKHSDSFQIQTQKQHIANSFNVSMRSLASVDMTAKRSKISLGSEFNYEIGGKVLLQQESKLMPQGDLSLQQHGSSLFQTSVASTSSFYESQHRYVLAQANELEFMDSCLMDFYSSCINKKKKTLKWNRVNAKQQLNDQANTKTVLRYRAAELSKKFDLKEFQKSKNEHLIEIADFDLKKEKKQYLKIHKDLSSVLRRSMSNSESDLYREFQQPEMKKSYSVSAAECKRAILSEKGRYFISQDQDRFLETLAAVSTSNPEFEGKSGQQRNSQFNKKRTSSLHLRERESTRRNASQFRRNQYTSFQPTLIDCMDFAQIPNFQAYGESIPLNKELQAFVYLQQRQFFENKEKEILEQFKAIKKRKTLLVLQKFPDLSFFKCKMPEEVILKRDNNIFQPKEHLNIGQARKRVSSPHLPSKFHLKIPSRTSFKLPHGKQTLYDQDEGQSLLNFSTPRLQQFNKQRSIFYYQLLEPLQQYWSYFLLQNFQNVVIFHNLQDESADKFQQVQPVSNYQEFFEKVVEEHEDWGIQDLYNFLDSESKFQPELKRSSYRYRQKNSPIQEEDSEDSFQSSVFSEKNDETNQTANSQLSEKQKLYITLYRYKKPLSRYIEPKKIIGDERFDTNPIPSAMLGGMLQLIRENTMEISYQASITRYQRSHQNVHKQQKVQALSSFSGKRNQEARIKQYDKLVPKMCFKKPDGAPIAYYLFKSTPKNYISQRVLAKERALFKALWREAFQRFQHIYMEQQIQKQQEKVIKSSFVKKKKRKTSGSSPLQMRERSSTFKSAPHKRYVVHSTSDIAQHNQPQTKPFEKPA